MLSRPCSAASSGVLMLSVHSQEVGEIVEFLVGEVELRHLPPARRAGRLRLHPGLQDLPGGGGILLPPQRSQTLPTSGAK